MSNHLQRGILLKIVGQGKREGRAKERGKRVEKLANSLFFSLSVFNIETGFTNAAINTWAKVCLED